MTASTSALRPAKSGKAVAIAAFLWLIGVVACGEEPYFESVLLPADTHELTGPHYVEAWVVCPEAVSRFQLRVTDTPAQKRFAELPFELVQGKSEHGLWQARLPGGPPGRQLFYYLALVDHNGAKTVYPEGAPTNRLLSFRLLESP